MSNIFTHHDRLYLFQSSFFGGTGASTLKTDFPVDDEELKDSKKGGVAKKTPVSSPTSKNHKAGGFSIYIPHFHKMFGLLSIINMLLYLTPLYTTHVLPIVGESRLLKLSFAHLILATSSFEFRIGRARNGIYTIYREMQLHTIIFTFRSFTVLMCAMVFDIQNIMARSALVLFWHILADVATHYYRPPSGETTIRRSVNGKAGYQEYGRAAHLGLWFFSFSQLAGTFLLLTDSADMARNAMFVMTPVQISAFLATLVRKGIFNSQISVVVYFLVLLPIFFYHHWTPLDVGCMVAAQLLRFNLRLNKYVMWIGLLSLVAYIKGDLHQIFADNIIPFVQGNNNVQEILGLPFNASAALSPETTAQFLTVIKAPATTAVPSWIYTETWQLGTGIGDAVMFLKNLIL